MASDARETLARLRALHANATPGPWHWDSDAEDDSGLVYGQAEQIATTHGSGESHAVNDARLIAAMRNALPALLDALDIAMRMRERIGGVDDLAMDFDEAVAKLCEVKP